MTAHPTETRPSYPRDDNVAYLPWFAGRFSTVFVALSPFVRGIGGTPSNRLPTYAKWSDVALACQFASVAHVNRALRMTGSKRVVPSLASCAETWILLEYCKRNTFQPPQEGGISLPLQANVAEFLHQSGVQEVSIASHFGVVPQPMATARFAGPDLIISPDILASDGSFYISIYTDYHYLLVCQTEASSETVDPSTIFEGFFANEQTSDFWGIGDLSEVTELIFPEVPPSLK